MVMAMLWRIPNYWRVAMRFMPIGRYENGLAVLVRAAASIGARGNGKCHIDAQHPKREAKFFFKRFRRPREFI